jgi:tetratricopeptide (TPR) repeat protein
LRLARERGEDVCAPRARGLIEWSLGVAYQFQGDFPRARRAFSQAIPIFERLNAQPQVAQLQSLLGQVLLGLQRHDEAEALLRQALGSAVRTGDPSARALALQSLAAVQLARGKPAKALRALQDGLALLEEIRDGQITGQLYLTLACASRAQQHLAATEAALTAAIVAFKQTRKYGLLARAYEHYGTFLADQGRFPEAYEQLRLASYLTASALLKQARGLEAGLMG